MKGDYESKREWVRKAEVWTKTADLQTIIIIIIKELKNDGKEERTVERENKMVKAGEDDRGEVKKISD